MSRDFIEINLLPIEDRKVKKDYSYFLDTIIVMPTLVLLLSFTGYVVNDLIFEERLEKLRATLTDLETGVEKNRIFLGKIKELERTLADNKAKNQSLQSITVNKELWIHLLEALNQSLPGNTWLTDIRQDKQEHRVTIQGVTHVFSEVASFMVNLEARNEFIRVNLERIELDPSKRTEAFYFQLSTEIKLDASSDKQDSLTAEKST